MARGVESFSESFDSFLVRYVSVKRRNVKCYQEGPGGSSFRSSNFLRKCVVSFM